MFETGLKDKVVLVTGANSPYGIGAATAAAFAAQGASVFITYLRDRSAPPIESETPGEQFYRATQGTDAEAVVQMIRASGGQVAASEANLADPAVIPQLFDQAEAAFGPVDVLINNAAHCVQDTFLPASAIGSDQRAPDGFAMQALTAAIHDAHFAVNSRAGALMIAEFARRHTTRNATWGRIINVSTDGAPGFAGEISYGASKYALESYGRAAAAELGQFGVTVNTVSLGPIQTSWITPEQERNVAIHTPLRRVGRPDDVADAIVLLTSEQARWITGQVIYIGGGHRMV